jgi:rhamnose utilization protein RhaD (predicted bifunctional aldolase and dehydrogenase)
VLAGHGLICWGESSKECYDNTIDLVAQAATYLNARQGGKAAFGGREVRPCEPAERATSVMILKRSSSSVRSNMKRLRP